VIVRRVSLMALAAVFLGAALLGITPALLTAWGSITLIAIGLALVTVIFLRRMLSRLVDSLPRMATTRASAINLPHESASANEALLKWSRTAFFLGVATVTESTWRPAFGLTVSQMFFFAALGGCLFATLRGRRITVLPAALVAGTLIFGLGGVLSSLEAEDRTASIVEVVHGAYVMLLWVWTGTMVLRKRSDVMLAIALWGFSGAVNGAGAVAQVLGFDALAGPLLGNRATGFTAHPNDLGSACAVALVPALLFASSGSVRGIIGAIRLAVPLLVAAGIVLSGSVASMLAATTAVVLVLSAPVVPAHARATIVTVLAVPIIAIAAMGGDIPSPIERVGQVTNTSPLTPAAGSGEARADGVAVAIDSIVADPLIGTGLDPAGGVVDLVTNGQPVQQQVHVAPVAVWYQAGVFGALGLGIVVASSLAAGWRGVTSARTTDEMQVAWGLLAAYGAFIIVLFTVPFVFQQYGWLAGVMVFAWRMRRDSAPARSFMGTSGQPVETAMIPG
jgi:hypothetical protein